jgi:C1A family cysteine protease
MAKYDGATYSYDTGGGHAVLLVGYDDTNPADSYMIMVNSWGTTP